MGFGAPLLLIGLAALAIPPIIHLLNRRRYDVVDWGAMRFLQVSEVTRRRLLIEEILLMLLRIGLLAVFVVGLASPWWDSPVFTKVGTRPNRDVVLVIDGSYSMGATVTGRSAHEEAKEWALAFVGDLQAGDNVAVLQAKQQVVPVVGTLSAGRVADAGESQRSCSAKRQSFDGSVRRGHGPGGWSSSAGTRRTPQTRPSRSSTWITRKPPSTSHQKNPYCAAWG